MCENSKWGFVLKKPKLIDWLRSNLGTLTSKADYELIMINMRHLHDNTHTGLLWSGYTHVHHQHANRLIHMQLTPSSPPCLTVFSIAASSSTPTLCLPSGIQRLLHVFFSSLQLFYLEPLGRDSHVSFCGFLNKWGVDGVETVETVTACSMYDLQSAQETFNLWLDRLNLILFLDTYQQII